MHCKFCREEIANKNFMRHLKRNHIHLKEVQNVFKFPQNSKERRHALGLLRNNINFDLYLQGKIRPKRQHFQDIADKNIDYYPCIYCKGLFIKEYLKRHVKSCKNFINNQTQIRSIKTNHLSRSQTFIACAADPTNVISQLNVKEQVLIMTI